MISKNRQSINSDDQFEDNTNEFDENSNESMILIINQTNNSPQKTSKTRNQTANKNRKFGNQNSDSNANGSLDDRHDEDSFNELQHNQQENHLITSQYIRMINFFEKTLIMMLRRNNRMKHQRKHDKL